MKNFKQLIFFLSIICSPVLFFNCSEDYSDEINSIKADITLINARLDSVTNAIRTVSSQITNLEISLKAKIDKTNTRIDSVTSALVSLKAQVNANTTNIENTTNSISNIIFSIDKLTTDITAINTSLTNNNSDIKKKTDAIILTIDSLMNSIKTVNSDLSNNINNINSNFSAQILAINNNYKEILFNYLELLKIVNSTPRIIEINGSVFKGSFLRGSLLFLYELDTNLNQTGRSFNTTIDDDYGNFDLKAQNLSGKLVRVVGDGFYWNEVLNENSSTRISLTGICKIDSNETVNVNVLTHLERARVEYLYNTNKVSFDSAKSQAVTEVLKAFGFENTGIKRAEKVGVVGVGDESKILLAISTLMQGYRTESEVTQIMNDFANDIKKDGKLDDVTIGNDLETHLYYVDTTTVLNNFKVKYRKLYNVDTVNSLDMRFIRNFQNNTAYAKDKDLIEFPEKDRSERYKNILFDGNTTIVGGQFAVTCVLNRRGIKIKVEVVNEDGSALDGSTFGFPIGTQVGWEISRPSFYIPTYTSNGLGVHDTYTGYSSYKKYRVNIYEKGFNSPSRIKYVNLFQ